MGAPGITFSNMKRQMPAVRLDMQLLKMYLMQKLKSMSKKIEKTGACKCLNIEIKKKNARKKPVLRFDCIYNNSDIKPMLE